MGVGQRRMPERTMATDHCRLEPEGESMNRPKLLTRNAVRR